MSNNEHTSQLVDVSAPGSLPFVDFEISDFSELIHATENLHESGHWAVRTPAGPLIVGYDQTREILRDSSWITVLSGLNTFQAEATMDLDLEVLVEKARELLPGSSQQLQMRPNVLSVEGEDHRRLRRLINSSWNTTRRRRIRTRPP